MKTYRVHDSTPNDRSERFLRMALTDSGLLSLDLSPMSANSTRTSPCVLSFDEMYEVLEGKTLILDTANGYVALFSDGLDLVIEVREEMASSSRHRVWLAEAALAWNLLQNPRQMPLKFV